MANHHLTALRSISLSGSIKTVALILADHANDYGKTWISQQTISSESGFSARTVVRAIATLLQEGLISVKKTIRNNVYTLLWGKHTTGAETQPAGAECKPCNILPDEKRTGEKALETLKADDQQYVIALILAKATKHPTLLKLLTHYGLNSSYVQTTLTNTVNQYQRVKLKTTSQSSDQNAGDRSWANGPYVISHDASDKYVRSHLITEEMTSRDWADKYDFDLTV